MTTERQSVDELRRSLVKAHQAEVRDPSKRAAGLEALLDAEAKRAAAPSPPARGSKRVIFGGVVVLVLGGVGASLALLGDRAPSPNTAATPPALPPSTPPLPVAETPPPVIAEPPSPEVAPPAEPTVEPSRPAEVKRLAPAPPVDDSDLLAKELVLVDQARAARKSDPVASLAALDRHAAEFPKGALRQEASMIRVEVLLALGRRPEAEALAKRMIAADRGGLVKKRLEALLGGQ